MFLDHIVLSFGHGPEASSLYLSAGPRSSHTSAQFIPHVDILAKCRVLPCADNQFACVHISGEGVGGGAQTAGTG